MFLDKSCCFILYVGAQAKLKAKLCAVVGSFLHGAWRSNRSSGLWGKEFLNHLRHAFTVVVIVLVYFSLFVFVCLFF